MKRQLTGYFFLLVSVILVYPSFTSARPNDVMRASCGAPNLAGPNDTTITLTEQISFVGQPPVKTWVANGAVVDSGTWVVLSFDASGSVVHSPVVGEARITLLLVGQDGSTITLQENDLINLNWPLEVPEAGSWHVVDGTGAYSTLQGAGRFSVGVETSSDGLIVTWHLDGHTIFGQP
jgi:hypothetical protein